MMRRLADHSAIEHSYESEKLCYIVNGLTINSEERKTSMRDLTNPTGHLSSWTSCNVVLKVEINFSSQFGEIVLDTLYVHTQTDKATDIRTDF